MTRSTRPTGSSDAVLVRSIASAVLAVALVLGTSIVVTARVIAHEAPKLDLGTDHLAPLEQAAARTFSSPSIVLAADGQTIGQFQPEQRFVPLDPAHIPPVIASVVTASEDPDFYSHHGFTVSGVLRATLANASAGEAVEGGSTITQQLAKNLYTNGARTLGRKIRELAIATELEQRYTKDYLLASYLNTTYFGEGAIGIEAASSVYFNKTADQLDLSEAAQLVGLIPAPSERDPRTNPPAAEAARLHVLERAKDTNRFDQNAIGAAAAEHPQFTAAPSNASMDPYFMQYVHDWLVNVAHIPESQVIGGGLRIESTLDLATQQASEAAVASHLSDPSGPTAAAVVLDHRNGYVRALVGGRDWTASKVDLARGADGGGTGRQPGSSFKPFVLATALQAGWRPNDVIPAPQSLDLPGSDHPIKNYEGQGYGSVSITDATVHSINTAYAWLTEQVGAPQVAALATAMGIGHLPGTGIGPSIGLGAYETSPMDMATAYSAFAEDGRKVTPVPVVKVVGPDGKVLVDNSAPAPGPTVLDPAVCRTVTDVLTQVVQRGTGTAAAIDRPVAGKTGTTDNYANAWFVGFTNQLTAAVWMGDPSGNTSMHDIDGVASVTGGSIPAAIWHDVMLAASSGLPAEPFPAVLPLPAGTHSGQQPPSSSSPSSSSSSSTPATNTPADPQPPKRDKKRPGH